MPKPSSKTFVFVRSVFAGLLLMLMGVTPLRAGPITVDGAGHNIGPLPLMIYSLAQGNDVFPIDGNTTTGQSALYLFGLFDTGSTLVTIEQPFHTGLLGISTPSSTAPADIAARTVEVRINGLGAINSGNLSAPIGSPFAAAQAAVGGIVVGPRSVLPTLIGAPVANQVVAQLDYTTAVSRGPYGFPVPDAGPTQDGDNVAEGFAITFFQPGSSGIPTPEITLTMETFGSTTPSLTDGASNGLRYLLRNVTFAEGAASLNDNQAAPTPLNFFYDSGTSPTIISSGMATSLGLSGIGTFNCLGKTGNGFVIDSVKMSGAGGTYTINNASVCVDVEGDLITAHINSTTEVDAVIGSNLFDQVSVLFDGPDNHLGIGISTNVQVPVPSPLLLLLVGVPGLIIGLRHRAQS